MIEIGQLRQFPETRRIIKITGIQVDKDQPIVVKYLYMSGPLAGEEFTSYTGELENATGLLYRESLQ